MLGTQLWLSHGGKELKKENIHPVKKGNGIGIKADGGLWTSTFLGKEMGSDWIQWAMWNEWRLPEDGTWKGYLCEMKNDVKIYIVDSLTDMHNLFDQYGYEYIPLISQEGIDFEKLAQDYDALHVTSKGEAVTRHGFDMFAEMSGRKREKLKSEWKEKTMRNLYGYDAECTFHFRWNFKAIKPVEFKVIKKENEIFLES